MNLFTKILRQPGYILTGLFSILIYTSCMAQSSIDYLKSRFSQYNSITRPERTYIVTDRFVYRPGEDLWFKGYAVSGFTQTSDDFFIRLISDRGDEVVFRRYPLTQNETSGRIVIPRSCIPGKYWLIAYTGWMKNGCPEEAFRKEILISKYFERRFTVNTLFDKLSYNPGDTIRALLQVIDPSGRPVATTPFDFFVETFRKSLLKGSGTTDVKGKSRLEFIMPAVEDLTMLSIEIRARRISGDFSLIIPSESFNTTVRFYPEGGLLIAGLPNTMVIIGQDEYGIPRQFSGFITNAAGIPLDTISLGTNGKAISRFVPVTDSMFFVMNSAGITRKFPLPSARPDGCLAWYEGIEGDSVVFKIKCTGDQPQTTYWTAVVNNRILWSSVEEFSGEKQVIIPVKGFPPGIIQVTVFDTGFNVISNRLIKYRNASEDLRVQLDRNVYKSRQRVSILVEYPKSMQESSLSLSVSLNSLSQAGNTPSFEEVFYSQNCVANGNRVPFPESDIDLIATDNYPVDWNAILESDLEREIYVNMDGLNGMVYDKKENVAPHAKVRVTHFPNFRLYETQTDEKGLFRISFGTDIIDYKFLNVDAYDAFGKTSLNPVIDYSYVTDLQKSLIKREYKEQERAADLYRYGEPDLIYDLRYGPGKFRKSRTDTRKKYDPYQYANYTDIMDIIRDIQPYQLEDNKIHFPDPGKSDSSRMPEAIIVINGALKGTNIDALNTILTSDITNINISDAVLDIRKYTPLTFNAVIEITTIQGMPRYSQAHVQTGGFMMDREFYSPDYSVESSYSDDNRKTLYWNPKIMLYKGNSMVVTFYTSDVKGEYNGHITGVDDKGNPLEKTFKFRVE